MFAVAAPRAQDDARCEQRSCRRRRRHYGVKLSLVEFIQINLDGRFDELSQQKQSLTLMKPRRIIDVEVLVIRRAGGTIGKNVIGKLPVEMLDTGELSGQDKWNSSDVPVEIDDLQRLFGPSQSAQRDSPIGPHERIALIGSWQGIAEVEEFSPIRLLRQGLQEPFEGMKVSVDSYRRQECVLGLTQPSQLT